MSNTNLSPSVASASSQKPTLVMLTGMVCDHAVWATQVEGLSDCVETLVPGYSMSDTMTGMAKAVLRCAPEKFFLAGHSMGGRVALEVLRIAPERVIALCLLGTEYKSQPSGRDGEREESSRKRLLDTAREAGMKAMAQEFLPALIAPHRLDDEPLVQAITQMIERQTPDLLEAQIHAGRHRPDSTEQLARITCPVLLIAGDSDNLRPAATLREMASMIPRCELKVIERCGHMITMEYPETVTVLMRQWISAAQVRNQQCT